MQRSSLTTLVITLIIGLGIVLTMGILCFRIGSNLPEDHIINLAILLTAIALGWLFGTFTSPDSPDEETRFSRYGTAIKAFASGYLVSKCDKLVTAILDPDSLFKQLPMFRFLLCLSGLLVATMVTYILREYVLESPGGFTAKTSKVTTVTPLPPA